MSLATRIEALLFATDQPLPLARLCEVLEGEERAEVETALRELAASYEDSERAFTLTQVGGGWQLATKPEHAATIRRLFTGKRRVRLTKAALESLAIIAYKQPTTRPEIDAIRGVASGGVLETLLERNLVRIAGRSEGVGRPLLYATTPEFLQHLGLNRLDDLPSLEELEAMLAEREAEARLEEEEELAAARLERPEEEGAEGEELVASEMTDSTAGLEPAAVLERKLRALELPTLEELDEELQSRAQQVQKLSAQVAAERARHAAEGATAAPLAGAQEVEPSAETAAELASDDSLAAPMQPQAEGNATVDSARDAPG